MSEKTKEVQKIKDHKSIIEIFNITRAIPWYHDSKHGKQSLIYYFKTGIYNI